MLGGGLHFLRGHFRHFGNSTQQDKELWRGLPKIRHTLAGVKHSNWVIGGGRQGVHHFGETSTGGLAAIQTIKNICPIFGTSPKSLLPSMRQTYCKYTSNAHSESKRRAVRLWCVLQVDIFDPQIFPLVALYCKSLKVTRKSFSSSPSKLPKRQKWSPTAARAEDSEN